MQSYLNAAARTDASLIKFPPEPIPQFQPKAPAPAQCQPPSAGPSSQQAGASQADLMPSQEVNADAQQPGVVHNKRRKLETVSQPAPLPLMDDDIDWCASNEASEPQAIDDCGTEADGYAEHKSDPLHLLID